jgi:hypothetical protein
MRNFTSLQSAAARCGTILALMAVGALLACQHKSPEQELLDKAEPAGSWIPTLQMAGEKWVANSVPVSFVKATCKAADKGLDQAAEEAAKSKARPEVRDPLRQLLSQARTAGAGLRKAAEANDRPEVSRQAGQLAALRQRFEAWKKGVEPP